MRNEHGGRIVAAALVALVAAAGLGMWTESAAQAAKLSKLLKVNAQLFRNAPFRVRVGMDEPVTRVRLWVKVSGTVAGNLQLRLRSPQGKEVLVHDRTGGSSDTITLEVPASELAGLKSGGQWTLVVDDQSLDIKLKGSMSTSRLLAYQLDIFYKGNAGSPGVAPLNAPGGGAPKPAPAGPQPAAPAPKPGSTAAQR